MSQIKSKTSFMIELLKEDHFSTEKKERLFSLISDEIKYMENSNDAILSEVQKIKKQLTKVLNGNEGKESSTEKLSVSKNNLEDYKDPKNTSSFLKEFNQNLMLKSTTHLIDENLLNDVNQALNIESYSYQKHIKAIKSEFKKLSKKFSIGKSLYAKIYEYLLGSSGNGWSVDKIKKGWSSPELIEWCEKHPGKCPNPDKDLKYTGFQLSEVILLQDGTLLSSFNDVVLHFKKGIEFRDESDLKAIVKRINRKSFMDDEINLEGMSEGVRFYSDVEKVSQAYKKIIEMCKSEHNPIMGGDDNPKFKLFLKEINDESQSQIVFGINHINSIFKKTEQSLNNRYGDKFTGIINNQLNGLCNIFLKAEFPNDRQAKFSVWPKNDKIEYPENSNYEGVSFELIFNRAK